MSSVHSLPDSVFTNSRSYPPTSSSIRPLQSTFKMAAKRRASASSSSPEAGEPGQPLNKDGTRRRSRVLRRKTDHSIIERRRREKINEKLVALQNLVPACRKECQDLIDRKFDTASPNNDVGNLSAAKRDAKRKREEEKLDKARHDMNEKVKTNMVLEKLCIISHTLDFVMKLQEENRALRALCDCRADQRRASITSDMELDEHYRNVHSSPSSDSHPQTLELAAAETKTKPQLSALSLAEQEDLSSEETPRPAKRRLHWGSDDVREAHIKNHACRHKCTASTQNEPCLHDDCPSSLTDEEAFHDLAVDHGIARGLRHDSIARIAAHRPTTKASSPCETLCRTKQSCCRGDDQSDDSSDPADLESPPLHPTRWPVINATGGPSDWKGCQHLPSIVSLGLSKQHLHLPSMRQDTLASTYRSDISQTRQALRPFRPLSLYTSHGPPSTLSKP